MIITGYDSKIQYSDVVIPLPEGYYCIPQGVELFRLDGKNWFAHRSMSLTITSESWLLVKESGQFPEQLFAASEFDTESCQAILNSLNSGHPTLPFHQNLIRLFQFAKVAILYSRRG